MKLLIASILLLFAPLLHAQGNAVVVAGSGAPIGSCPFIMLYNRSDAPGFYYCDDSTGTWVQLGSGSGSGDVNGPASSSVNDVAVFADTTGKLLTNLSLSALFDAVISSTQGAILFRGSSAWSALGPGTDGYVLTTHGASADVDWSAAAGGGISGSGTTGQIPVFSGSTAVGDSALDDGVTTSGTVTSTEPIAAPSYSVSGNPAADGWAAITDPTITVVGSLGTPTAGVNKIVTDGVNSTDCTSGGGSNKNWCQGNGSAWIFKLAATNAMWLSATTTPNAWSYYNGSAIKRMLSTESAIALSNLATQSANTAVANVTSGSAVPTAVALPSGGTNGCSGTTDAAIYTAGSGWGCHQITASAPTLGTAGIGYVAPFGLLPNTGGATNSQFKELTWQFTCCTGGVNINVKSVNIKVTTAVAASNFIVGIRADSSGAPGSVLCTSTNGSSASNAVVNVTFSSTCNLTYGTIYWFSYTNDTASVGISFSSTTIDTANETGHTRFGNCTNSSSGSGASLAFASSCGGIGSVLTSAPNVVFFPGT